MGEDARARSVVRFYETHPINERQIHHDLACAGIAFDRLTESMLEAYDQDHFGGLEAVDTLAERAGIGQQSQVLDVCSGIGGPARHLADRLGCRVTGIDLTPSRVESATRLTELVGLGHLVGLVHGNALDMPFATGAFDVVIGQEAFAHVPGKPRLIAECVRVVRPGGTIAFTDILRTASLTAADEQRLERDMTFLDLESAAGYCGLLSAHGCAVAQSEDLSGPWAAILRRRLEMYRGLGDTTIERFGEDHFRRWDRAYAFFVDLYAAGALGGGRFIARKQP